MTKEKFINCELLNMTELYKEGETIQLELLWQLLFAAFVMEELGWVLLSFSVRFILTTHEREHILFPKGNSSWELDHSLSSAVLKSLLSARKSFLILHFSPFSPSLLSSYWYCHISRKKKKFKETRDIYSSSILGVLMINLKFTINLDTKINFLGGRCGVGCHTMLHQIFCLFLWLSSFEIYDMRFYPISHFCLLLINVLFCFFLLVVLFLLLKKNRCSSPITR